MVLPSNLQKSHLQNSSETSVVQQSDSLEFSNLERHDLQAGGTPQEENNQKTMAWHSMFCQRLFEPQCLKLHRSPVNACILSEENAAGFVTMYSVDKDGFIKMRVHDDTVSCVCMSGGNSERMLTASWDSTIKLWGIGERRGSWVASNTAQTAPEAEFMEHDSAVWSLDVQPKGHLAISGAKDGIRIENEIIEDHLQHQRGGSATGLRLTDDANQVVVAFVDGSLRILETMMSGIELASKECGSSLRYCEVPGDLIIAGSADCSLFFWSYVFPSSASMSKEVELATEFLDYSPIRDHTDSINYLSLACHTNGRTVSFAMSSNDCSIKEYSVGDK